MLISIQEVFIICIKSRWYSCSCPLVKKYFEKGCFLIYTSLYIEMLDLLQRNSGITWVLERIFFQSRNCISSVFILSVRYHIFHIYICRQTTAPLSLICLFSIILRVYKNLVLKYTIHNIPFLLTYEVASFFSFFFQVFKKTFLKKYQLFTEEHCPVHIIHVSVITFYIN